MLDTRTPRQDLQGKVTFPYQGRTLNEKDKTSLQPRHWDGLSSLATWVVESQHQIPL